MRRRRKRSIEKRRLRNYRKFYVGKKIHTEAVYSLEEIKVYTSLLGEPQHFHVDLMDKLVAVPFTTYSDLYFKDNQSLNSRFIRLGDFSETATKVLVSNKIVDFSNAFVPFYRRSSQEFPGVLLDTKNNISLDLKESPCIFKNHVPVFTCVNKSFYPSKVFDSRYCRTSIDGRKRAVRNVNLDEIVPVLEDLSLSSLDVSRYEEEPVRERDVILLNPLLLESATRPEPRLIQSEHKKMARITILYVLAFFALILVTFFVIYLA
ncbi:hypothetical protein NQ315_011755 [Exocentrus adspersus]|uniref:Uncharacterized protein n=1 Tax=Exocentrus adspersus TaxID=1586481 RepID=A0AAV8W128_9CUCU|nr:hypothetical protein NQ315_011755 [Exocentrus adspersus]